MSALKVAASAEVLDEDAARLLQSFERLGVEQQVAVALDDQDVRAFLKPGNCHGDVLA